MKKQEDFLIINNTWRRYEKTFSIILSLVMVTMLCACGDGNEKYDEYTKLAPNLYEVTCDDYDYNYMFEDGIGNMDLDAGCSAIKEGNYLGRNFDFIAGDAAEVVVKVPSKEGRYASVGMTGGMMWLTT